MPVCCTAKSIACNTAIPLFAFYNSALIQQLSFGLHVWETVDSQQEQEISLFSKAYRPALGPTQPPIQWALGLFP
jgi:hypothetical protein